MQAISLNIIARYWSQDEIYSDTSDEIGTLELPEMNASNGYISCAP
jgi:hypothetical protein